MNLKQKLWLIPAAVLVAYALGLIGHMAWGHPNGHAEGITHLTGRTTPSTARENYVECPGQNKLLGYYDMDGDRLFDVCATMWQEHKEIHIILSKPDITGKCECEGYLWLEGDSQVGE